MAPHNSVTPLKYFVPDVPTTSFLQYFLSLTLHCRWLKLNKWNVFAVHYLLVWNLILGSSYKNSPPFTYSIPGSERTNTVFFYFISLASQIYRWHLTSFEEVHVFYLGKKTWEIINFSTFLIGCSSVTNYFVPLAYFKVSFFSLRQAFMTFSCWSPLFSSCILYLQKDGNSTEKNYSGTV